MLLNQIKLNKTLFRNLFPLSAWKCLGLLSDFKISSINNVTSLLVFVQTGIEIY
jgi:hypothetical protein